MTERQDERRGGDEGGASARVALLTPVGKGALAVVGIAGWAAVAMIDAAFRPRGGGPVSMRPDGAICFGRWTGPATTAGEDVIIVRHAADHCEIHCHGGLAAPQAVLQSLVARGAAAVSWETWLHAARVGAAGPPLGPAANAARAAICRAGGPQAARILARQIAGALDREIDRITGLHAGRNAAAVRAACDRLLRAGRIGLRLTTPWRVAVVGPVNAGKSSLVNALAGHARSLVSATPGTTRDLVVTRLVLGGWEFELVDTAGFRDRTPLGDTERAGIDRARAAAAAADVVLRVRGADDPRPSPSGDVAGPPAESAGADTGTARPAAPVVIDVVSKLDLVAARGGTSGRHPQAVPGSAAPVLTSAVTGTGIDQLADRITSAAVPEATAEPDLLAAAVPFTAAQLARIAGLRHAADAGVSRTGRPPSSAREAEV